MSDQRSVPKAAVGFAAWLGLNLLGGCATHPDDIQPLWVSDLQYAGYSCAALVKEQDHVDSTLVKLVAQQRQTRIDDVYGYIFTLMPLGRLAGRDREAEIALFKGQHEAVLRMEGSKGCTRVF